MTTLLLVRAPGLSVEQACRGDMAATLSDLIADGSFAAVAGPADLPELLRPLANRVQVVELPFRDMPSFDAALEKVRSDSPGSQIAVLSDSVFVSQRYFPEIKPGAVLAPADVGRFLSAMAG